LRNWIRLQAQHECFFFIADWHALTDGYEKTAGLDQHGLDMLVDWLAAGLDPSASSCSASHR
jgi:tryptophanyl-tRNA synthetase